MLQSESKLAPTREEKEKRKILVVGRTGIFSESIMEYSIHLAERLHYGILAVDVREPGDPGSYSPARRIPHGASGNRRGEGAEIFRRKAAAKGVCCDLLVKHGDLGIAVAEINHGIKRVEFVLIGPEVDKQEITREMNIPVFSVMPTYDRDWEGESMAGVHGIKGKKPLGKTVGYGLVTAGLYGAVFTNAGMLMQTFTKGGWYAALPIATAFAFSFAHGAFASHLWSLLGIEARKTQVVRQTEKQVVRQQKRVQKKPRPRAYVNPFHNL